MVMICYDNIKIIVVYGESVLGGWLFEMFSPQSQKPRRSIQNCSISWKFHEQALFETEKSLK